MSSNKVIFKRSSVAGRAPTPETLDYGEVALNYADGRLYYKDTYNGIKYFEIGDSTLSAVFDPRDYVAESSGDLTFSCNYQPGYVTVYVNGVRQASEDVVATDGYNVTILGLTEGDEIQLMGMRGFLPKLATKYDRREHVATEGQVTFDVNYQVTAEFAYVQVFVNGILLKESEYTATATNYIVLSEAATEGDIVECIGLRDFSILDIGADGIGLEYDTDTGVMTILSDSDNTPSTVVVRDASGNFSANTITAEGDVNVGGNLTVTGTTTFNGGTITLGDAASDNVVFGADVNSDVLPNTDGTYDLGSPTQEWQDLFIDGTATIDTLQVDENAIISGSLDVGAGIEVGGHILPDTDVAYDLGSATNRFRDLYLSGSTIDLGGSTISSTETGGISVTNIQLGDSVIEIDETTNKVRLPHDTLIGDGAKLPPVDLEILPEVLNIQVSSDQAGDDITWKWTWLQSTLPYARATITNSPQLSVPLYKKGTYTLDNFIAYETFGDLTQVHPAYLKWVDGAGTDNLVDWATYVHAFTSHEEINGGASTEVQRYTILVPEEVTLPTLTLPQGIGYDVSFMNAGSYSFGMAMEHGADLNSVAHGENPNIGPMYRGATYTFHLDSTLANHPFYLTTDNGQGFVSGQYVGEYTSGVVGSRNNGSTGQETLVFTVPADAPDILYYQCGIHGSMRGVITIKDLAVEVNSTGNYVLYFQHTHEGHKTPVEIRPIPSLVNQMCLVYSAAAGKFVPQDLSTYIENTPSFKEKIRSVAGTATLVDASGEPIVATVKIFTDPSYLPFAGNKAGDIAYTEDTNTMFIWDETAYNWVSTKAKSTTEIAEGTNLYYTEDRVDANIAGKTTTDLAEGSNLYYTESRVDANIASKTTDDLTEGTNLYYTTARANSDFDTRLATKNTSNLTEGTNLYWTTARGESMFDTRLATKSTTNLAEGTNLYFTTARARSSISVTDAGGDGSLAYNSGTGVITYTGPSSTEVRAHLSAGTGVHYSSGQFSIGQAVETTSNVTFGNVNASGNLVIDGNLTVNGSTVTVNTTTLAVEDNMIYMNEGSTVANPDLGWAGNYNDGVYRHAGFFRDASDGYFKAFHQYTPEPDAASAIDTTHASFALADIQAANFRGALVGNASTSSKWVTARTITLTGDVSGSTTIDGSANVSITTTVANDSHTHDWSNITNRPDPVITLTGAVTGSATMTDLGNVSIATTHTADPVITLAGDLSGSATLTNLGSATLTATIQPNSVALGTDTTGNYMVNVAAGTDIAVSHTQGEGSTATVSNTSTLQTVTNRGATTTNVITHGGLAMSTGTNVDQIYSASASLTLTTGWQDTGINGAELASGSYIVQITSVSDNSVGGQQYEEYYTGVMSWFAGNTNSSSTDEIVLHRAGHAPNAGALFLRVIRTASADPNDLKLQISGLTNNTGAYTYNFKFRRLI